MSSPFKCRVTYTELEFGFYRSPCTLLAPYSTDQLYALIWKPRWKQADANFLPFSYLFLLGFLCCYCCCCCFLFASLFFAGGGGGGVAFRRPMPEPEIPPFREFAPPLKNSPFFAKMVMDVCFNREWRAELWPIDAIWWHMFGSAAAQVMVLYTKPLPEPMSTYNQWSTVIFVGEYFHKKYHRHQSLKLAWNILI